MQLLDDQEAFAIHDGRGRRRRLAAGPAISRALHRVHHRRILHGAGAARAARSGRPDEPRRRVPARRRCCWAGRRAEKPTRPTCSTCTPGCWNGPRGCNARRGGGSLTALPIAATQAGNIAAYIPTNLISITDGQIYLDTQLFNEGLRPAVDVGLSVSRVGGKAQPPVLRKLAGDLRLLYAQLHELETFARFGAELEPETRRRLERGRRLREALKQTRLRPWRLGHEAATLYAVREGLVDSLAVEQVGGFLDALARRLDEVEKDVAAALERDDGFTEAVRRRLGDVIAEVRATFQPVGGP